MELDTPVNKLKTVGSTLERRLKKLGVDTARDLLFYFPFRHEDWRQVVPIAQLRHDQEATVRGKVELIASRRTPRKRKMLTEATVRDDSGILRIVWFNQPYLVRQIRPGTVLSISGKVREDGFGTQMVSPMWERAEQEATHTARIIPVYPTTAGITQKQLRFLIKQALPAVKKIKDWLPNDVRDQADVCGIQEAIQQYHFPDSMRAFEYAQARLKFDELLLVHMLGVSNRGVMQIVKAPSIPFHEKEIREYVESLPFALMDSQKKSAWEMLQDIQREYPMNRLLEGDVGAGKTVVASIIALNAVLSGFQVAIMAPTEILAFQHFQTLCELLRDRCTITLLTRAHCKFSPSAFLDTLARPSEARCARFSASLVRQKPDTVPARPRNGLEKHIGENLPKRKLKDVILEGTANIAIGTHALIQEDVEFRNLGLVIVDEQHRFGVEQRKILKEKSGNPKTSPHFLSMTATPIPRSFALTVFGDLDISIIPELPPGRKSIKTRLVEPHNRQKAYDFVRKQIEAGRQVFVVCPLIDPSDKLGVRSVKEVYERLSKEIFSDLPIALLHGRMKGKEKEEIMSDFRDNKTKILVSTSVIEVGVDIPNATIMWLEGAERFGLAQLHQFRGRVGRGEHQSFCLVFSDSDSQKSLGRLRLFEKENNGFILAEKDLEMRGPGEVFGKAQSGMMHLQLARLTDRALIKKSREVGAWLFEEDPSLARWPSIQKHFDEWRREVHLE